MAALGGLVGESPGPPQTSRWDRAVPFANYSFCLHCLPALLVCELVLG